MNATSLPARTIHCSLTNKASYLSQNKIHMGMCLFEYNLFLIYQDTFCKKGVLPSSRTWNILFIQLQHPALSLPFPPKATLAGTEIASLSFIQWPFLPLR